MEYCNTEQLQTFLMTFIAMLLFWQLLKPNSLPNLQGLTFRTKAEKGGYTGKIIKTRKVLNRYWCYVDSPQHGKHWIDFQNIEIIN